MTDLVDVFRGYAEGLGWLFSYGNSANINLIRSNLTEGQVKLKLIPPQSSKYLDLIKDYENGEYRSPITPWDVQQEYKAEYDKVKALDIDLQPGMMIYIPAYWWCSIKYEKMSSICSFQYRTYMNTLAVLPELIMGLLQRQNIQRQIAPKVDTTSSTDLPT